MESRLPMWMTLDGEFTVTVVDAWLLVALSSGVRSWLAVSVWLPIEVVLLVLQLKVSVVWSPDATKIAYVAEGDIWVVPASGGAPLRVTSDKEDERAMTW